jgi:membrane protease YdiL (CAAX protease family)
MTRVVRLVGERAVYPALGVCVVVWAPIDTPTPRLGLGAALLAGAASGCLAFAILARRVPPLGRSAVARAVAVAAPVLAVGAAGEEAVWRYGALRGLEPLLGAAGAIALSTLGFAAAHAARTPLRALPGHLSTGAAFGCVYVASGWLAAAVLAHVVYNLLVVAACAAWTTEAQAVA